MSHPNEYGQYPFVYPCGYPTQGNVTQGTSSPITAVNSYAVSLSLPGSTIEQGYDCFLKVINPDKKSEYRVYTLKNLSPTVFENLDKLRKEILRQVGTSMVSQKPDFTIDYFSGQTKVWIKDQSDLKHVWQLTRDSSNTMLWCDGFQERLLKRARQSEQDSDDAGSGRSKDHKKMKSDRSSCEDKRERIETLKTKLRSKHGTAYTPIQYTLWAEMIDVGTHSSIDEEPAVPMFKGKPKVRGGDSELSTVFTEMAKSVITVLKPTPGNTPSFSTNTSSSGVGMSPGKLAELRSKYLQQMRDLHELFSVGALTEKEFCDQKAPILDQLTHLNPQNP